ncbi:Unknown protein, partial [Striga hermonthica]
ILRLTSSAHFLVDLALVTFPVVSSSRTISTTHTPQEILSCCNVVFLGSMNVNSNFFLTPSTPAAYVAISGIPFWIFWSPLTRDSRMCSRSKSKPGDHSILMGGESCKIVTNTEPHLVRFLTDTSHLARKNPMHSLCRYTGLIIKLKERTKDRALESSQVPFNVAQLILDIRTYRLPAVNVDFQPLIIIDQFRSLVRPQILNKSHCCCYCYLFK